MSGQPVVILIVEDSADCAATLEIALDSYSGFAVQVADSAEEALRALNRGHVGAVITDLHLPAMDGLEFLSKVRQDGRFTHLPVLVISGDTDPETPRRVRAAGGTAYFSKPYSPGAVRQKLEELIHGH